MDKFKSAYHTVVYEGLWNFVVDFFEDVPTPEAKETSEKLLKWWNQCVILGIIFVLH
jgi:hypothetical protein